MSTLSCRKRGHSEELTDTSLKLSDDKNHQTTGENGNINVAITERLLTESIPDHSERLQSTRENSTIEDQPRSFTLTTSKYIIPLPDHLVLCQDQMERLIKNSLEDIEETNEIVRGLERLSTEKKLGGVRKRYTELQEEYEDKRKELQPSADTESENDESDLSSPSDKEDPSNNDSDDSTSDKEDPSNNDSADSTSDKEDLSNNNDSADSTSDKEDLSNNDSADLTSDKEDPSDDDPEQEARDEKLDQLFQEYDNKISDYLKEQLNITFSMTDEDVRGRKFGDVIFYYLMRGDELDEHVQQVIQRLPEPLCLDLYSPANYVNWYQFFCSVLFDDSQAFTQIFKRIDNNQAALEYLLYKQPQLLLHKESCLLLKRLIEHLSPDTLRQVITNIRDENGQTCMFYITAHSDLCVQLYNNRVNDWYELLSIRNASGQTALHVNASFHMSNLLAEIYTPAQREAFIKLLSITDYNNKKTALQVSNDNDLSSLIRQVTNNEYVTLGFETSVLIIYNTNNRSEAKEEAQTIYEAFKSKSKDDNVKLEKNKTDEQILQLITQEANKTDSVFNRTLKSLIVILMSHGTVGTIDDCSGNTMQLSDIEEVMCSGVLDERPKMLITQCCQNTTQEVDKKLSAYAPTHPDFCAVMSSVSGQKSKRGLFLGKLAEEIEKSNKETNIFKLVNNVSREMEKEGNKQTPIIMGTLKAEYCPTSEWWKYN